MPIRHTKHACNRMVTRGISDAEVKKVIETVGVTYPGGEPGKKWMRATVDGHILKVLVLGEDQDNILVITVASE